MCTGIEKKNKHKVREIVFGFGMLIGLDYITTYECMVNNMVLILPLGTNLLDTQCIGLVLSIFHPEIFLLGN